MDDVYDSWWKVWMTKKLLDFIPQPSKWKKTNEQLREGDIVIFLKSDSENRLGEPVWRIARMNSVRGRTHQNHGTGVQEPERENPPYY